MELRGNDGADTTGASGGSEGASRQAGFLDAFTGTGVPPVAWRPDDTGDGVRSDARGRARRAGLAVLVAAPLLAAPLLLFSPLAAHVIDAPVARTALDVVLIAVAGFAGVIAFRAYLKTGFARNAVLGTGLLAFAALLLWSPALAARGSVHGADAFAFAARGVLAGALLVLTTTAVTDAPTTRRRVTAVASGFTVSLAGVGLAYGFLAYDGASSTGANAAAGHVLVESLGWAAFLALAAASGRFLLGGRRRDGSAALAFPAAGLLAQEAFLALVSPPGTLVWWLARGAGAVALFILAWSAVKLLVQAEQDGDVFTTARIQSDRLSAIGTLVSGVAHEINNPLLFIRGNVELALTDVQQAESRLRDAGFNEDADVLVETLDGLQCSLEGTDRIARITKSLKIVARQGAPSREPVDLNEVVSGVHDLIRVSTPRNIALHVETAGAPVTVLGNESELQQVFFNLVQNATEAIGENGGRITVKVALRDEVGEVAVTDSGPGIPADTREKLFHPFYTTKANGTGLGLPIVHTIVKSHDGDVLVQSPPGGGATFRVRFPVVGAP